MRNKKIPNKIDNPKGYHLKYKIMEFSHFKEKVGPFGLSMEFIPVFKHVDKDSEYFVLRLNNNQKDKKSRDACIKDVLKYAEEIKDHMPELSQDLIKRYK